MTIKDMEQLTGITRQNIRFYEREGLITPCRNPENQYREYSMEDAVTLKRIRLYRKLNVSIEDIRKLESRTLSLQSCMEQCISNTEKEMARMAKMKEVCEELRKQDLSGADPDVDKTLEQIDAYERSGYQFADISKDYWNMEVVNEIRGMNRQVAAALLISFMLPYIGIVIYFLLGNVPWMLAIPYTVIGYGSAWFLWGRKNTAVLKKHVRAASAPATVWLAAAVIGILFYPVISGNTAAVIFFKPEGMALLTAQISEVQMIGLLLLLPFRNTLYSLIACVLFYDTLKQKSIISALGLSALLFALSSFNPYTAAAYLFVGICLGLLYEFTDSAVICVVPIVLESAVSGGLSVLELLYPGVLPEILGTRQAPLPFQLLPWWLLSVLLIAVLLYLVSHITGKKIDWSQEWAKVKMPSSPDGENTILDQSSYRKIEKERKRSYRLMDGYLMAGFLLAIWFTAQNLI